MRKCATGENVIMREQKWMTMVRRGKTWNSKENGSVFMERISGRYPLC